MRIPGVLWKTTKTSCAAHLAAALDLLLPPRCVACLAPVGPEHAFCPACAATLIPAASASRSGLCVPPPTPHPAGPSPSCQTVTSLFLYGGQLAVALARLKYGGQAHVARPLGRLLARQALWQFSQVDGVVPVPLHPRRLVTRGYNQAALLAATALRSARPTLPSGSASPTLIVDALRCRRLLANQTRLSRAQRLANVRGAFLAQATVVSDRKLLLIDDVTTTGATANACARALLAAGAAEVHLLTLARALP